MPSVFDVLSTLETKDLASLLNVSTFQIYEKGDEINLVHGGLIMEGRYFRVNAKHKASLQEIVA